MIARLIAVSMLTNAVFACWFAGLGTGASPALVPAHGVMMALSVATWSVQFVVQWIVKSLMVTGLLPTRIGTAALISFIWFGPEFVVALVFFGVVLAVRILMDGFLSGRTRPRSVGSIEA
ncbi:MAG: hypothetical protein R3B90_06635 [Planctomycetaceae bacterium]